MEIELKGNKKTIVLSHGGINHLADGQGDHRGLPGTGLRLGDNVAATNDGDHGPLLDRGGLLEPLGVGPAEEIVADAHLVEAGDGLHPGAGLEHQILVVHGAAWRLPNPRGHGAGGGHGDEEGGRSSWDFERKRERARDDTNPTSLGFRDAFVF
ncbi:hypothetical protein B296_00042349 [Ensete ventricosum]|uniref:Uncharacterized protein n=1 Tax=Ensete ventricosum TaxID=4639 RepID=A0A426ZIQ7_ENSVE|nr:hypothetical protein B296_00042349 [Ensete ventricosum]